MNESIILKNYNYYKENKIVTPIVFLIITTMVFSFLFTISYLWLYFNNKSEVSAFLSFSNFFIFITMILSIISSNSSNEKKSCFIIFITFLLFIFLIIFSYYNWIGFNNVISFLNIFYLFLFLAWILTFLILSYKEKKIKNIIESNVIEYMKSWKSCLFFEKINKKNIELLNNNHILNKYFNIKEREFIFNNSLLEEEVKILKKNKEVLIKYLTEKINTSNNYAILNNDDNDEEYIKIIFNKDNNDFNKIFKEHSQIPIAISIKKDFLNDIDWFIKFFNNFVDIENEIFKDIFIFQNIKNEKIIYEIILEALKKVLINEKEEIKKIIDEYYQKIVKPNTIFPNKSVNSLLNFINNIQNTYTKQNNKKEEINKINSKITKLIKNKELVL